MRIETITLPWHKLNTKKQNWIVIEVGIFISLVVIGAFAVMTMQ